VLTGAFLYTRRVISYQASFWGRPESCPHGYLAVVLWVIRPSASRAVNRLAKGCFRIIARPAGASFLQHLLHML
jgi:hypothetical protein